MRPKKVILCIDDNDQSLSIRKFMLETRGYRVLIASNGREAIDVFQNSGAIDLVLTDLVMPRMNGIELLRALQQQGEPITTVILTKGNADQVGGLPEFPADIQIVAHENTKANMVRDTRWSPGDLFKFEVQGCAEVNSAVGETWLGMPFSEQQAQQLAHECGFELRYHTGAGEERFWLWFFKE